MAFTTWAALRTSMLDAIADSVAGTPCTGEYAIGNRRLAYRSYDELIKLYEKTYVLEALESSGDPAKMVSYGSYQRLN